MSEKIGEQKFTRRDFLKVTGTAAAGTALLSGIPLNMRNLKVDTAMANTLSKETTTLSTCSWSCSFCQYKVIVRDGHVVRTEPQEGHTQRMCLRGRSRVQRTYSEERIKYPMRRVGERGANEWERITWEEAIDLIATQWKKTAEAYGPLANCKYQCAGSQGMLNGNAGMTVRLFNALEGTLFNFSFDYALVWGMMRAGVSWFDQNEGEDWSNSQAIITWGANPTDANIQQWQHIANAQEKGTQLVVIDPIFSGTAAKADYWIRPYPGTDAALVLGICKYLIDEKKYDAQFVRDHTNAPFLINAKTRDFVRLSDFGIEPTVGPVNPATGAPTKVDPPVVWDKASNVPVSVYEVREPAITGVPSTVKGVEILGTAWDQFVAHVQSWTLEKTSEVTEIPTEDIIKLANICATGKNYHYVNYGQGAYANGLHAGYAIAILFGLTGNFGKEGSSVGGFDYVFGAISGNAISVPSNGSRSKTISILNGCSIQQTGTYLGKPYPPLKNILITHANLLTGNTNSNRVRKELLDPMEQIVVVDIDYTETARYADILLPAADVFEYEDVVPLSHERNLRISEKAIDPLYESKRDSEISRALAEGFGLGDVVNDVSDDDFWKTTFDTDQCRKFGISIDSLREKKLIRYVPDKPYIGFKNLKFGTETGRITLYAEKVVPRLPNDQPYDPEFERLPQYFENPEASRTSALAEKYPFILLSKRNKIRIHSVLYMKTWAHDVIPEPIFYINPEDAKPLGIKHEDYVELYNDRGHVVGKAIYSEAMRPGIICYPKGYQKHECISGSLSEVTTDQFDTCAVNCSFFDNRVAVRPWKGDDQS